MVLFQLAPWSFSKGVKFNFYIHCLNYLFGFSLLFLGSYFFYSGHRALTAGIESGTYYIPIIFPPPWTILCSIFITSYHSTFYLKGKLVPSFYPHFLDPALKFNLLVWRLFGSNSFLRVSGLPYQLRSYLLLISPQPGYMKLSYEHMSLSPYSNSVDVQLHPLSLHPQLEFLEFRWKFQLKGWHTFMKVFGSLVWFLSNSNQTLFMCTVP